VNKLHKIVYFLFFKIELVYF